MKILGYIDDGISWFINFQKDIFGDWFLVFMTVEIICIFFGIFYLWLNNFVGAREDPWNLQIQVKQVNLEVSNVFTYARTIQSAQKDAT